MRSDFLDERQTLAEWQEVVILIVTGPLICAVILVGVLVGEQ